MPAVSPYAKPDPVTSIAVPARPWVVLSVMDAAAFASGATVAATINRLKTISVRVAMVDPFFKLTRYFSNAIFFRSPLYNV